MEFNFTDNAKTALDLAKQSSIQLGHGYIGTEHILLGLVREEQGLAGIVLRENGISDQILFEKMSKLSMVGGTQTLEAIEYTPRVNRVIERSLREANNLGKESVGTEHILISLLREYDSIASKLISIIGADPNRIYKSIVQAMGKDNTNAKVTSATNEQVYKETPTLDQFSRDMTKLAKEGKYDPIIGRDTEIERIIQILSRRTKNNPCLIGEPGVGKTAIIEGLAQKIITGNIPETLENKRVVALDLSSMVAGSKYRGEFEERIKKAVDEIRVAGNIILFIDEIHTLVGAGAAEGAIDAANILKPSLSRGEIQLVGATTLNEYRKHIEKDPALERRFQPVKVEEPSEEYAIGILKGLREIYEKHHKVSITIEAIEAAVKYSSRYITDRYLPDKAIDVVDEASSKKRLSTYITPPLIKELEARLIILENDKESAIKSEEYEKAGFIKAEQKVIEEQVKAEREKYEKTNVKHLIVDEEDIAEIISAWTGIPIRKLTKEEGERLKNLENALHERVIGQNNAVEAVAKAIRRGRVGLKDPNRPVGSFLFLGPTGVGKTELSKALAEVLFGKDDALIRVDMSEYMEKHSVSKLIGSPPGYVGYDEGGQLSEKIRRKPYSVILFDEVEKAHPDVFNILLQVLDDGHITDSQGRKIDFKNTVIIMTSNIGARSIISPKKLGFVNEVDKNKDFQDMKGGVMEEVKKLFKPEFLNRLDEMIVFHPLSKENIIEIVTVLINQLTKRLEKNAGMHIEMTEAAKLKLAEEGYDVAYGARPLKRAIQSKIEDRLAEEILAGTFKIGQVIKIDYDETYTFKVNETIV